MLSNLPIHTLLTISNYHILLKLHLLKTLLWGKSPHKYCRKNATQQTQATDFQCQQKLAKNWHGKYHV